MTNALLERFRAQMPVAAKWAYFDHAAVGPLTLPARTAMEQYVRQAAEEGDTVWPQWHRGVEAVRPLAARLLHCRTEEIALVKNTTTGIGLIAEGYPWQPGDNVVTLADEFPSNLFPWLNLADRGVEIRRLPTDRGLLDLAQLAAACDAKTRIVALSWVGFASGYRQDLDAISEIVHRQGALLFVDAIQGLGVFPLDVSQTPIDFLAGDGHKWLLGPEGAGLLYIRHEHLDRLRPLGIGWNSVVHAGDFNRIELNLKPAAERYEGGSENMAGMLALAANLELFLNFGVDKIAERILQTTSDAVALLRSLGCTIVSRRDDPRYSSGIVSFEAPGADPLALRQHCLTQGVVLSCRAGRLRISPHAYNNADDLDRLVAAIKSFR